MTLNFIFSSRYIYILFSRNNDFSLALIHENAKTASVKLTGRGHYLPRDYRTKFGFYKFRAGISHEIRWRERGPVFLERA